MNRRAASPRWRQVAALPLLLWTACTPDAPAAPARQAPLREVDGVRVLHLDGTQFERGVTEGELLGREIVTVFREFAVAPGRLPGAAAWDRLILPLVAARAEIPPHLREQAEGIVAGIRRSDPAALHVPELGRELTVDDLLATSMLIDLGGFGCSSLAVYGERVEGGGPLVGRNLDYPVPPAMLERTMLIVHAPDGPRRGFTSIGWPGMVGIVTAISDAGVSVAIHDVEARARLSGRVTPRMLALREIVEQSPDSPETAAAALRAHEFAFGGNAMVAWRGGAGAAPGAAVLEFDPGLERDEGVTARIASDQSLVCTNHHRARAQPEPCWRFDAITRALPAGKVTLTDVERAIRSAITDETIYSAVIDLRRGTMRIAFRRGVADQGWLERTVEVRTGSGSG
jgi:hypothetical protein